MRIDEEPDEKRDRKRDKVATWLWIIVILVLCIFVIPYCIKHWNDGVPLPPEAPQKY